MLPLLRWSCGILWGLLACASVALAKDEGEGANDEWSQWRGPHRDGASPEEGLLQRWTGKGPALAWKSDGLGSGYSSVTIANGRLFTLGNRNNTVYLFARDAANGKPLWSTPVGAQMSDHPASTPTIDNELVYALGPQGDLICAQAADGKIVWQKSYLRDFGGATPQWKFCESVLIDGDKLICTPGSADSSLVALDKLTGSVIWKCSIPGGAGNGAGYSSPVASEGGGIHQYVQMMGAGVGCIGVDARNGKLLWKYPRVANGTATIPTPIVKDNFVFCSSGYQTGAALLELKPAGNGVEAREVYFLNSNQLQNHHGGLVLVGDYVYGGHGHNQGFPICVELKTGKIKWGGKRGPGSGSAAVVYADKQLYFRYEDGLMALISANPKRYKLEGKFKIPEVPGGEKSWAHPVVLGGKLYLREQDSLVVYHIHAK